MIKEKTRVRETNANVFETEKKECVYVYKIKFRNLDLNIE